ncbi:MAG: anti-sigma factor family protein [Planctomycetota bacterium]|jgi:hypothetical protein
MNCNQARTLLAPWLDDELDARATAEVEAHLQACAACQQRFTAEERVEALIAERLHDEPMPEAVWDRLQERIGRRAVLRWPWMAAAAALLVLALALTWLEPPAPPRLIRGQVLAHQAGADAFVPVAQTADMLLPITRFLSGRDTDWTPPGTGEHDGHVVQWVGAETGMVEEHEALSVRLICCDAAVTVFVMDSDTVAGFPDELATAINKGETVRSSLDGVFADTFRDGDVLVSIVSEHDTSTGSS